MKQQTTLKTIKRSKGASLTEFILWSVLVIGIVAAVFAAYLKAKDNREASSENSKLTLLQTGIKGLYQGRSTYVGLTEAVLINAQAAPNDMVNGTALANSWGGAVTVVPASLGGIANNAYAITYPNVPRSVCTKLVLGTGQTFDTVLVGTTTLKVFGATDIDPAASATACNNNTNTIVFTAR
jgi:PilS N terminal